MKLSSISLIALAVIAGGATAGPAPRPFEHDVDIYTRATHQALVDAHQLSFNHGRQAYIDCLAAGQSHHANTHIEGIMLNKKYRDQHKAHVEKGTSEPLLLASELIAESTMALAKQHMDTICKQ